MGWKSKKDGTHFNTDKIVRSSGSPDTEINIEIDNNSDDFAESVRKDFVESKTQERDNVYKPTESEKKRDDALNLADFTNDLEGVGAKINPDGTVTVYHYTDEISKQDILNTGKFFGKEDGIFFTTKIGGNASDYGNSMIILNIPLEKLEFDDLFDDEAWLRIPTKRPKDRLDLSEYVVKT